MSIVTITSDFGWRDYYLALLKGAILTEDGQANIVDISHDIETYNIVQAAFILKNTWRAFPVGTIHIVSVHDLAEGSGRFLAMHRDGHYFIGPDNGVFSLLFDVFPDPAFLLPFDADSSFPLKDVYARAVGHISKGLPLEDIGPIADRTEQRITLQPVISHSKIRGAIIYIDQYSNVVTNIHRDLFERVGAGRHFLLYFKRHDPITVLSADYHGVAPGENLCRFNSAGYLEIAINLGKAASLLGLNVEDTVEVNFQTISFE